MTQPENETLTQKLADNLNRNVLIEHILDMPPEELRKRLEALTVDELRKLAGSIEPNQT